MSHTKGQRRYCHGGFYTIFTQCLEKKAPEDYFFNKADKQHTYYVTHGFCSDKIKLNAVPEISTYNKQKKEEYQQKLLEEVSGKLVINKIKLLENSVENIKYNIKIQMVIVKRQEEQVEIAQQKLDNAVKERKIYEKLKEKAFENFKAELNAEEQKEVDELVSFRFGSAGESEE